MYDFFVQQQRTKLTAEEATTTHKILCLAKTAGISTATPEQAHILTHACAEVLQYTLDKYWALIDPIELIVFNQATQTQLKTLYSQFFFFHSTRHLFDDIQDKPFLSLSLSTFDTNFSILSAYLESSQPARLKNSLQGLATIRTSFFHQSAALARKQSSTISREFLKDQHSAIQALLKVHEPTAFLFSTECHLMTAALESVLNTTASGNGSTEREGDHPTSRASVSGDQN